MEIPLKIKVDNALTTVESQVIDRIIAELIFHEKDPLCYSSNIGDAFRVIERFRRGTNGKVAACVEMTVSDVITHPDCTCKIYAPDIAECVGTGQEMPEAICKAAIVFIDRYCDVKHLQTMLKA